MLGKNRSPRTPNAGPWGHSDSAAGRPAAARQKSHQGHLSWWYVIRVSTPTSGYSRNHDAGAFSTHDGKRRRRGTWVPLHPRGVRPLGRLTIGLNSLSAFLGSIARRQWIMWLAGTGPTVVAPTWSTAGVVCRHWVRRLRRIAGDANTAGSTYSGGNRPQAVTVGVAQIDLAAALNQEGYQRIFVATPFLSICPISMCDRHTRILSRSACQFWL
jgi:hypothetical protein